MARSGRFGHLPRAAPSLTSVMVSLAREMAARQDANVLDAWNKGGEVDGEKITDEKLLQHLRDRRDGVDRNDPLWDTYDNLLTDYSFSIEESKMSLRYARNEVDDGQMAAFYSEWANKLPTDSEAYRNLARSAAQFLDAAKRKAEARGAAARGNAYKNATQAAYDRYQRPYDEASFWMTQAAIAARLIGPDDDINDLRYASAQDQAVFYNLFDEIAQNPDFAFIRQNMAAAGLTALNYGQWVALSTNYAQGLDARIRLAVANGKASEAEQLRAEKVDFTHAQVQFGDLDELDAYAAARADLLDVLSDPSAPPGAVQQALNDYGRILNRLHDSAQAPDSRLMLSRELDALNGKRPSAGPTAGAPGNLLRTDEEGGISDAESTYNLRVRNTAIMDGIGKGELVLTSEVVRDQAGNSVTRYVPVSTADPSLQDPAAGMLMTQSIGGGRSALVWVPFKPIFSVAGTAISPRTGRPLENLNPTDDRQVGVYYVQNGKTYFGVFQNEGQVAWFSDNPFVNPTNSAGLRPTIDPESGAMTFQWTTPGVAYSQNGVQYRKDEYDPFAIIPASAIDPTHPNSHRFDTPVEALNLEDPEIRRGLLSMSAAQIAATFEHVYAGQFIERPGQGTRTVRSSDGSSREEPVILRIPRAQVEMQNWVDQRNTAAALENNEFTLTSRAARRSGMLPFTGDEPFSPIANPYDAAIANINRQFAGQPSEADRAREIMRQRQNDPEFQAALVRSRAATMVAKAQFEREQQAAIPPMSQLMGRGGPPSVSIPGAERYAALLAAARRQAGALPTIQLPGVSNDALGAWVQAQTGQRLPQHPTLPPLPDFYKGGYQGQIIGGTQPISTPTVAPGNVVPKGVDVPSPAPSGTQFGGIQTFTGIKTGINPATGRPYGSGPLESDLDLFR